MLCRIFCPGETAIRNNLQQDNSEAASCVIEDSTLKTTVRTNCLKKKKKSLISPRKCSCLFLDRVSIMCMCPEDNFFLVEQRSCNSSCSSCCTGTAVHVHVITISRKELHFSLPEKFSDHSFKVKALLSC